MKNTTMTTNPINVHDKVTVALPVHNGADSVERSIISILNQTFRGYQLLILDNCSTDDTPRICQHYARLDNRIAYIRNSSDIGAKENFSKGLSMAKTEYFCWLAHDDERHPEFLQELVSIMDQRPEIGMAASRVVVFNPDGTIPDIIKEIPASALSQSRYSACLWFLRMHHWWYSKADFIYGVYRTSLLRQRFCLPNLPREDIGSDVLFIYSYMANYGCHISERHLLVRHSKYFFPLRSDEFSQESRERRRRALWEKKKSSTEAIKKFRRILWDTNRCFPMLQRAILNSIAWWYCIRLRALFS
jgi:glycosyltransferase involved in cell wall biosynthesis